MGRGEARPRGGQDRDGAVRRALVWLSVAAFAETALAATLLLTAASATAGSYAVLACDAAPGTTQTAWREREERGMLAASRCPTRGEPNRGLTVRNRVNAGTVRRGNGASMAFRAPAGASLRSIEVDWRGRRVSGDWLLGLVRGDGRVVAGCRPKARGRGSCRLRSSKGSPVRRGLEGTREVRIEARCAVRRGCDTSALRRADDPIRARLAVHAAEVVVADSSAPNVTASGELLRDGWQRGKVSASILARDNVGIRGTSVRAGGTAWDVDSQRCDFSRAVPCPRGVRTTHRLDTGEIADGRHVVTFSAADAAGNRRHVKRGISVDNHAPGRVSDVRLLGGSGLRSENSFDLRWRPPPRQAAPIVRARYRLCRSGGSQVCVTGSRAGGAHGIDALRVPSRGSWRFQVWLEDEAGNTSEVSASAPVTLKFDDRDRALLSAGIVRGDGRPQRRGKVDFGDRATVAGSLSAADGREIGQARLAVVTRVRGSERFRRVRSGSTNGSGRYRVRLPAGPSRTVRIEFAGDRRYRPAGAAAELAVRARSSISVSRRRVENGDRVRFRGKLLGGRVPDEGKLVQLEAFYRDRWRTFAVVRSSRSGRWGYTYRFEATRGRVRYPFRVRVPREHRYPYALGRSRVVRVTVNGG
jgi:hypothetical protein